MAQALRFRSLDALRGLSILGMAWASMVPDSLPAWMYHAQEPPPNHDSMPDLFGITWVDLVFPIFLFSMGAAIPIAISNRSERGESNWKIFSWLAGRALLLATFALFSEHLRPGEWTDSPTTGTWIISLFFFGLLICMFGRWPETVPLRISKAISSLGWMVAIALILFHSYPDGNRGFENSRIDIILMVLANVAFSGAIIWWATRCRPLVRLGAMIAISLLLVGKASPGSLADQFWNFTPIQFLQLDAWKFSRFFPIVYHFEYHKYLLIVLPGTICGDLIRAASTENFGQGTWSKAKAAVIAAGCFGAAPIVLAGLFWRDVISVSWISILLCTGLIYWTRDFADNFETLVARMIRFGAALLILGLIAEPIGGGVSKDPTTLSYFLICGGLAFLLLACLEVMVDMLGERKVTKFLWLAGMNPILAYACITNVIPSMSELTHYSEILGGGYLVAFPWLLAIFDGGMKTLLVGFAAAAFTRKKVFLRT